MKFRTEVDIKESSKKISIEDKIFSIGSCFSSEMSEILSRGQLQTLNNPFGTIFNPYSIHKALERISQERFYQEEELIYYNEDYISLDHHTQFSSHNVEGTLEKINQNIKDAHSFLKDTKWVIITYGTSFIYEYLPQTKLVANCHKIPQKFFNKRYLTQEEIISAIKKTITLLKKFSSDNEIEIIFTISPVRHTKDGMVENMLSKSKLITAVHEVVATESHCHYLPSYEIIMDDLRDYRFYKEDMIHPSKQAVEYIFEKFGSAYFSSETHEFLKENFKIAKGLEHRTQDEKDSKYLEFRKKLKEKIAIQQKKVKHILFKEV